MDLSDAPSALSLFPHQVDGVQWMLDREHVSEFRGGLLCDDVGLGKSAQIVATMLDNPLPATLLVGPVNILTQWVQQLEKWGAGRLSVVLYHGAQQAAAATRIRQHCEPAIDLRVQAQRPARDRGPGLDDNSFFLEPAQAATHTDSWPRRHYCQLRQQLCDQKQRADAIKKDVRRGHIFMSQPPPLVVVTSYDMLIDRAFETQKRQLRRRGLLPPEMRWACGRTVLHQVHWDRVVLDECHLIRNSRTLRSRYALKLSADIHWGLTATPVHNGIGDYFTLLHFLGLEQWQVKQMCANNSKLVKYVERRCRRKRKFEGVADAVPKRKQRTLELGSGRVTSEADPVVKHHELLLRRTKAATLPGPSVGFAKDQRRAATTTTTTSKKLGARTLSCPPRAYDQQMPPLHVHTVELPFTTRSERDFYRRIEKTAVLRVDDANDDRAVQQYVFESILRQRQASVHPDLASAGYMRKFQGRPVRGFARLVTADPDWVPTKIAALRRMVASHRDEKALVFCEFREEMPYIQRALAASHISSACYDGSLNLAQRQQLVTAMSWTDAEIAGFAWKESRGRVRLPVDIVRKIARLVSYDVLLVQINSGNAGLNMQMCSRVYFTNINWNPCIEIQAIGRSHRMGQTRPVHVTKLVLVDQYATAHSTIDQRVLEVQQAKQAVMADILDDPDLLTHYEPNAKGAGYGDLSLAELHQMNGTLGT